MRWEASTTTNEMPSLVSSLAADKPADPAPIIITSVCVDIGASLAKNQIRSRENMTVEFTRDKGADLSGLKDCNDCN